MSFDLAAGRAFLRFLCRDPNGDALADAGVLSNYINPAYLDWWRLHERRPGNLLATITTTDLQGLDYVQLATAAPGPDVALLVEDVTYRVSSTNWQGLKKADYDRLYYLQNTEGLTGTPEQVGFRYGHLDSSGALPTGISASPWLEAIWYPIPDSGGSGGLTIDLWATAQPTLLATDSDKLALDPVSARMVFRLAAYRLGVDMGLEDWRLQSILAPLEPWVQTKARMDALLHGWVA